MNDKAMSIKNDSKISYLAREITNFINRGSATTEKISATLREIKEISGLKSLKSLEQSHINKIVEKLKTSDMSLSNKNSYISSINNIVKYLNKDSLNTIKAADYGLSRDIKENDGVNKENTRESANAFKNWLNEKAEKTGDMRYSALRHAVEIQFSAGLRLRESLQVKLLNKDLSQNSLSLAKKNDGAKNSRAREIHLNSEQKQSVLDARQFLKDNHLVNLNVGKLLQGRNFANNTVKEFMKEQGVYFHYHGERHFFVHNAYKAAWAGKGYAIECRARTGESKADWAARILETTGLNKAEFQAIDKEIRQGISKNLGHERIEITNRYLG